MGLAYLLSFPEYKHKMNNFLIDKKILKLVDHYLLQKEEALEVLSNLAKFGYKTKIWVPN